MSSILDLIDSAVHDWETSPDAARYNAPGPAPVCPPRVPRMWIGDHEVPITDMTWTEVHMETRPAPWSGAEAIRMASEYQQRTVALFEGQLLAGALEASGQLGRLVAVIAGACESVVALSRALRLEPWPHGWNEPCACHPAPFPAARDYRRRTKHRNRRRQ